MLDHEQPRAATAGSSFRYEPQHAASLAAETRKYDWLVERVLAADLPTVLAGPAKCLMTSITVDLAISLASGSPFLGRFRVPNAISVAVLSGDPSPVTLADTARRIARAKQIELPECSLAWQLNLPKLFNAEDLKELQDGLRRERVQLVVIDSLPMCLLDGARDVDAGNLYHMEPLLLRAAHACRDAGATPLFVHNVTKTSAKRTESDGLPELSDLQYSGVAEVARQWILLGRQAPFEPGSSHHALNMVVGGNAGHSSAWRVAISEGTPRSDATPSGWDVSVLPYAREDSFEEAAKPSLKHRRAR
jgi:hypothetical protein